ncbi:MULTISPECIES: YncE family protein [unclassified Bradyrhizobium]|uniref:YncE family protein n=1 Tax=unclassified Bradyrhizobium TaxID=2631580 RepID=UPI002478BA36|nr:MULTISPECIES: YncE family protein [unclassified Bradyrhizobium]WGS23555.1 YncE family protein [Bradyrhizobium sp. ISRA463]WGS30577.1 YncE family protein [Bradyrhizobium sp. ISRA464]
MAYPFRRISAVSACIAILAGAPALSQSGDNVLQLEGKILLGDVRGRIDHMAVDAKRLRLIVAELGNDTVGIVDLARRSVIQRITGLKEPQGVGYEPSSDTLYVANARDGSVRFFQGETYEAAGGIDLGSDADNVRIDAAAKRVVIGYGDGGLAVLDAATRNRIENIPLKAHPESFQLDPDGGRIFVNLPDSHAVAVIGSASGKSLASWPMDKGGNFAMAIDRDRKRILVAFRSPPELSAFSMADGKQIASVETCGDIDDLFVDRKRNRIYASCGAGFVDVFEVDGAIYRRLSRIPTAQGARTSFFAPELDRLLVAARATSTEPAAIWILRPLP